MMTTTLDAIRAAGPYPEVWKRILRGLGKTCADDELLPYSKIVYTSGLSEALWACRAELKYERQWRRYIVRCIKHRQGLLSNQNLLHVIDVADQYACGKATDDELFDARELAYVEKMNAEYASAEELIAHAVWCATFETVGAIVQGATGDLALDLKKDYSWSISDIIRDAQRVEFLRVVGQ